MVTRRTFLGLFSAANFVAACSPADDSPDQSTDDESNPLAEGRRFLARFPSVDVHAHPGRFFLSRNAPLDPSLAPLASHFADQVLADMNAGGVSAAAFSTVGDLPSLFAVEGGGIRGRETMESGVLAQAHELQMHTYSDLLERGSVMEILEAEDLSEAHATGRLGIIKSIEGADYLEGDLGRLDSAGADGVRQLTMVHYRPNAIGDIQTSPEHVGGLSEFGERVVHRMNQLGMIVDVAHASQTTVQRVADICTAPIIASHTNLQSTDVRHPRLISEDYARIVADTGGLVGAWPAGIGIDDFDGFIVQILRLADVVGTDHVGIGTDMDANYKPVFRDYNEWPLIPAGLLERGLAASEVAAIMGGNYHRVFASNRSATSA